MDKEREVEDNSICSPVVQLPSNTQTISMTDLLRYIVPAVLLGQELQIKLTFFSRHRTLTSGQPVLEQQAK